MCRNLVGAAFTRVTASVSTGKPNKETLPPPLMRRYFSQSPALTVPALNATPINHTASSSVTQQHQHPSVQLLDGRAELDEFMAVFPDVVKSVTASVQRYEQPATTLATTWLEQAMLYNVPKGKRNRGLLVVSTFKLLLAQKQPPLADETKGG